MATHREVYVRNEGNKTVVLITEIVGKTMTVRKQEVPSDNFDIEQIKAECGHFDSQFIQRDYIRGHHG